MAKHYDEDTIGPVLARLREARGYTQDTLAQLLCAKSGSPTITRNEISRWERQERLPSKFWLTWLAQVLAVPLGVLEDAVAAARYGQLIREGDDTEPTEPAVSSWLTLHHGPAEVMIALSGVEVDQFRTVLAPVTPPPSTDPEVPAPTTTVEANQ